jgi:Domain of Unknown Function (DUF928)
MTVQPIGSTRKSTRKLLTAFLAACLLPIALPMLPAIAAPGYKPPSRKAAQRTEGTGRRNASGTCAKDLAVPLTWLMPTATADSLPETTLEKPPLFLYLAKPKTLLITLIKHPALGSSIQGVEPVWKHTESVKHRGIIQLAYPKDQPPLETGKTYSLRVEVDCGADQPEGKRYGSVDESVLSRVEAPRSLQMQLQSATAPRQRAEIYATAGLWVETLESTMQAIEAGQDPAADQDLRALLEQVGLTRIARLKPVSRPMPKGSTVVTPSPVVAPQPVVVPSSSPTVEPSPTVAPQPTEKKKDCHHQ